MNPKSTSSYLRYYLPSLSTKRCYIDICIINSQHQYLFITRNELHLVQKNIIEIAIHHPNLNVLVKHKRSTQFYIFNIIQCYPNNMIILNTCRYQVLPKDGKKQIRFANTPNTCYYYYNSSLIIQ